MAGRGSSTALSTKTLKEKVGKEQLVRSKLDEELSSLLSRSVSLCDLLILLMPDAFLIALVSIPSLLIAPTS